MTLPNGSASASERTLACPAWLAFPHVHRSGAWAERGHQIHGYIRAALTGVDPARALDAVEPAHRATCAMIDWRGLGGDLEGLRCEVAYAIDVRARTARFLGENIGRDYARAAEQAGQPLGPFEVPGSSDIEGTLRSKASTVVVIDTKTGFLDVTPAEDNGQGLFFASAHMLLPARTTPDEVEFRIARVRASGDVWDRDRFTFGRFEVDAYLDEYEAALERAHEAKRVYLAGGTPDVTEGPWCAHCPAADHCPAKTRLVRAMLAELGDVQGRVDALTLEQVGRAWELANERAKPVLETVLEALKERIHREGLVLLPDGKHAAKSIRYPRESFSQKAALALLEKLGASQAEIAACFSTGETKKVQTVNAPKTPKASAKKGRAA